MPVNDLRRFRKIQQHNESFRAFTLRGTPDFTDFEPATILAGDIWFGSEDDGVTVNNLIGNIKIFKGDWVVACVDDADPLTYNSYNAGQWDIIRRIPADWGAKQTGVDGGRRGWTSFDDDYLYSCVVSGNQETISGAKDGTAVWKKTVLTTTT